MNGRTMIKKTGIVLLLVFSVTLGTSCAIQQQIREDREATEAAMKAAQTAAARVEAAADRVEAAADRAEAAAARADRTAEKCERIFQKGLRK
jgi:sensor c-di-GMP phosphodiesterase-like protein